VHQSLPTEFNFFKWFELWWLRNYFFSDSQIVHNKSYEQEKVKNSHCELPEDEADDEESVDKWSSELELELELSKRA
jgi:hypothetical protein